MSKELNFIFSNIQKGQESTVYLSSAVKSLIPVAEETVKDATPTPDSFVDQYSLDEINTDTQWAENIYSQGREKDTEETSTQRQYAIVMEAILLQHGELSDWFGKDAYTVKTTKFDDIRNGLDLVLSLPPQDNDIQQKRQNIGIDVTFSQRNLAKKLDRAYTEVCEGQLAEVKYYACEDTHEKGTIRVPRITLAITREHVTELAGLWLNKKNTDIANHAVKGIFLKEIEAQLQFFMSGARRNCHEDLGVYLEGLYKTIKRIRLTNKVSGEQETSFFNPEDTNANWLIEQCDAEK